MTRRNLLKSLLNLVLSAPFLPLVWREKAEVPVAEPVQHIPLSDATLAGVTETRLGFHLERIEMTLQGIGMIHKSGHGVFKFHEPVFIPHGTPIQYGIRSMRNSEVASIMVNGTVYSVPQHGTWTFTPDVFNSYAVEEYVEYDCGL